MPQVYSLVIDSFLIKETPYMKTPTTFRLP